MKLQHAFATALLTTTFFTANAANAVGTRTFVLDSLSTFKGGELDGVSLSSSGTVRAGLQFDSIEIPKATSLWSTLAVGKQLFVGTGPKGSIYRVSAGKVTLAAHTETMAVTSLSRAFGGDVVAGTFPGAKLFRAAPGKLDGGTLKPWVTLPDSDDIWALSYDAKRKKLFVATGPNGKIFHVDEKGKAEVYFDSEENHIVSLDTAEDGTLYAGSSGSGLLYAIRAPGRANVVYDFDANDVKAIRAVPKKQGGGLYAIANTYKGSFKSPRPSRLLGSSGRSTARAPRARKGKGQLMRFDPQGRAELMFKDDKTHFSSLALDERGAPVIGTGSEGRVVTVDVNHDHRIVADTDSRQVGAVVLGGNMPFIAASDPVVIHPITGRGGPSAIWTSRVLDAGMRATFGRLNWRSEGQLDIQTRSGNTAKPDGTWSSWSSVAKTGETVKSPAGRYIQVRGRWSKDAKAVLHHLELSFLTDNARALVMSISVGKKMSSSRGSIPASGGKPPKASPKKKLSWKVDNPDKDSLRYRLFYRLLGSKRWYAILPTETTHTSTSYTWDTNGVPEGRYELRVDASDELSNPPDRARAHSLVERPVLVDNTAPRLSELSLKDGRLKARVTDVLGPIARVEFAPVGTTRFFPVFPKDGVFDQASEQVDADVSKLVPKAAGGLYVVRAYDRAGNRAIGHVTSQR